MEPKAYDVIVLGLGGAGSSAFYNFSKDGYKVLGIEKFDRNHKNGSSHGESRIIRKSYFEGLEYMPLLLEAYNEWELLEKESGRKVYKETGYLCLGKENHEIVQGCVKSAKAYNLPYRLLSDKELREEFPLFKIHEGLSGFLEKEAGILNPDLCVTTFVELALKNANAQALFNTGAIKAVKSSNGTYEVFLDNNTSVHGKKLVLSLGAYLNDLLKESFGISLPLKTELNWVTFFNYKDGRTFKNNPVFYSTFNGDDSYYGLPDIGSGIKVSCMHSKLYFESGSQISAKTRELPEDFLKNFFSYFKNVFNDFDETQITINGHESCLFTMSPDKHFLIDFVNGDKNVLFVSACSGHGFKFISAIGKYAKEVIEEKRFIDFFSLKRLKNQTKF